MITPEQTLVVIMNEMDHFDFTSFIQISSGTILKSGYLELLRQAETHPGRFIIRHDGRGFREKDLVQFSDMFDVKSGDRVFRHYDSGPKYVIVGVVAGDV